MNTLRDFVTWIIFACTEGKSLIERSKSIRLDLKGTNTWSAAYVAAAGHRNKRLLAFCARLANPATFVPFTSITAFVTTASPALDRAEVILAAIRMDCARYMLTLIKLHCSGR